MASSYPGGLDSLSTSHQDNVNEPIHASAINDLDDAVNKIEAALGVNPQQGTLPGGLYSSVVARLNALDNPAFNFQNSVAAYTLSLADMGQIVNMFSSSASTITIPPHSSVAFPLGATIVVRQGGTGGVTFAAGVGVTLHARGGATQIAGQYGWAYLIQAPGLDVWDLTGDVV